MPSKRLHQRHGLAISSEHYLRAILELHEERGYARAVDIATRVGVTKGSVSAALGHLAEQGLIKFDAAHFSILTTAGRRIAQDVRGRYVVVLTFLTDILGLPIGKATSEACRLEHVFSNEAAERLYDYLRFASETPRRRDVIEAFRSFHRPRADGWPESRESALRPADVIPLDGVQEGDDERA